MRRFNIWTYGVFFAGCYLGAGFVSGNELTQFFGNFGLYGFLGLLIILFGFTLLGTVAARFAKDTGITEVDRLAVGEGCRPLRVVIGAMQIILMFAILTIVHAGVGALLHSLFSIPVWLGSLLFAAAVLPIAILGIGGVARVLALSVPLLTATVVVLAILLFPRWIAEGFPMPHGTEENPLLPTFWIGAITYISFNMGGNIAVVLASTENVDRKRILPGTAVGALLLVTVASAILIVLSLYPGAMSDELPMLTAAREVHPILGYGYGLLLLLAMSGSALSKCFGISHYAARKWATAARHPRLLILLLVVAAYLCSLVGFGDLVGTVYPVFGYLSVLLLIAMLVRAYRARRKKREN